MSFALYLVGVLLVSFEMKKKKKSDIILIPANLWNHLYMQNATSTANVFLLFGNPISHFYSIYVQCVDIFNLHMGFFCGKSKC